MSEITNVSTEKELFVVKTRPFCFNSRYQANFLISGPIFSKQTPDNAVRTFILAKRAFGRQLNEESETREYKSDCTEISSCSLVFPLILSKGVFFSKILLSVENPHLKFNISEITNLSTGRAFLVKNTAVLLQFKVSDELLHFWSDLL